MGHTGVPCDRSGTTNDTSTWIGGANVAALNVIPWRWMGRKTRTRSLVLGSMYVATDANEADLQSAAHKGNNRDKNKYLEQK